MSDYAETREDGDDPSSPSRALTYGAPIVLNGTTKKPNPVPQLEPSPTFNPKRKSMTIKLDDMEPPPPIPAAIEEQGYRSRPTSPSSRAGSGGASEDGYLTPNRRGSAGTDSTTGWGEHSPGSSPGEPSNGRRRVRGIFRSRENNSTLSVDDGEDTDYGGVATPASRRSVNFRQTTRPSGEYTSGDETETPGIKKRPGFFKRLKKLGTSSHGRSFSGWTLEDEPTPGPQTPGTPYSPGFAGVLNEDAESDLEPPRRRSSSPSRNGSRSAPTTPRLAYRPRRRATVNNIPEEARARPSLGRHAFSRRSSLKRTTTNGTSGDGERPSYIPDTSARWKAIKAGIRMIGHRKMKDSKIDREKSAELVAELSAGTPAALILASMFQRDEHGNRRIPVLLEQLKVKITDSHSSKSSGTSRRSATFRIELEYGSGLTRMKWVIHRDFRDFFNLHSKYRLSNINDSTTHKLPKFPRESIPYLRGVRGLGSDDEDADGETSGPEGRTAQTPLPSPPRKKRPLGLRKKSSMPGHDAPDLSSGIAAGLGAATAAVGGPSVSQAMRKNQNFVIRQRQQLQEYLQRLIRIMIFRPDSNRLCKFLELSALGVRLAAEGSYHGKEGYLIIRSAKGSDFRRGWNPATVAKRHAPKWFLVRHSYIVCVDSPEEMNIYDVFLVDSAFDVDSTKSYTKKAKEIAINASNAHTQHHRLTVANHERTLKLLAKNERQLHQFTESIRFMKENSIWSKAQRFQSFAPVRKGVFAQWLVDGRDYYWNASRAISMAKDVIYIHDWWLSPELYMRRPPAVSQKWRLDRLLQRKAQEGVKIFVIVYRNIGAAIPIDSEYTKYSLLDLDKNVYVQRSPNQFRQNTFFWAHHEKILIVDHMIAFVGGLDLCFGRWDTPQHSLVDDRPSGFEEGASKSDPEKYQLWPGKDYSNPRVQDFFELNRPYNDMYDRERIPRMPWHDIHMQIVGQPARDLTRHFVQRWNYLLRQRTPSRPTPLLLPPPDFTDAELESLGIDGTCEVQILRSASSWSLGTPDLVEHSIQNAYLKSIEMSEHLVYIENQFFITSTEMEGTLIQNKIGDALVERIIRAYNNDEDWRAIIIIPLMPGFQNTVDAQDGTSVRLIMQCQYRSISRGESSIFGRLKAQGIEPEDYITFYSLRTWGKIGPQETLITEQLYIHAKCMIVDDRITIIGSANINERSMLGNRDSEVAAIVRDTDTILSTMAGKPYRVGRFPHTLRVRLMREHLGMDVDEIMTEERLQESQKMEDEWEAEVNKWHQETETASSPVTQRETPRPISAQLEEEAVQRTEILRSFNHDVDWEQETNPNLKARKKGAVDSRVIGNQQHKQDVRGFGVDHMAQREAERLFHSGDMNEKISMDSNKLSPDTLKSPETRTFSPLRSSVVSSSRRSSSESLGNIALPPLPGPERLNSYELGLPQLSQLPPLPQTNDHDIGGPIQTNSIPIGNGTVPQPVPNPVPLATMQCPTVTPDMFEDPLNESFYNDVWYKCAMNNTEIYRAVFRCMPDNEVKTWAAYKEYVLYGDRFQASQRGEEDIKKTHYAQSPNPGSSGPPGARVGSSSDAGGSPTATTTSHDRIASLTGTIESGGVTLHLPPDDNEKPSYDGTAEMNEKQAAEPLRDSLYSQTHGRQRSASLVSGRLNTATTTATNSTATPQQPGSRGSLDSNKQGQNNLQSNVGSVSYTANTKLDNGMGSTRRRRRGTKSSRRDAAGDSVLDKKTAEELLKRVQGHLVMWPHEWLCKEEEAGNWLYNIDQLAPIEIYD